MFFVHCLEFATKENYPIHRVIHQQTAEKTAIFATLKSLKIKAVKSMVDKIEAAYVLVIANALNFLLANISGFRVEVSVT